MVQGTKKESVTFKQFAKEVGVPGERLRSQFDDAGIPIEDEEAEISEDQKQAFLKYLRAKHETGPEKIVLRRAKTSEIKLTGVHGPAKTVSIQVRKKRTYVKRPAVDEQQQIEINTALPEELPALEVLKEQLVEVKPVEILEQVEVSVPPVVVENPALTEVSQKPAEPTVVADNKEEEKNKNIKRKEKRVGTIEEEADRNATKKKRKSRDTSRESDRNFEALLSRGADLSRVLTQAEEDFISSGGAKKSAKFRAVQAKVKVQAFTKPTAPIVREVEIPEGIMLSDLAQRLSVKAAELIKILMKMGTIATINQTLDQETAILLVEEMGHKAKPISANALEYKLEQDLQVTGEAEGRPPVITIMGHVDHGKTTLLDYIRTTKVAASEAGGITQHIGAYHVQTPKGTITFLDTPGHAAFTAMRARGAKLTDIVILVVAVDDGVMPQTIEAIQHAKAAEVPIVVAINKMDKPGVDPDRIKNELSKHGLIPEEWGGDTMFVPISAKAGTGVDGLLDSVLVQAEVLDLKAVAECSARGVVIESRLERGRGAVMSVLVQQGTLHKGDIILVGFEYGRIRALFDETGKAIVKAGPSIPVEVLGLSGVPQAGDDFLVVPDEKRAREVALFRENKFRESKLAKAAPKLEDFLQRIEQEKSATTLNLIIKADVLGSVEALKQALTDLSQAEVRINVISGGVGGINESDVNLAIASSAIIIAFNVRANAEARKLMEINSVDVHYYNIIYDVINEVKKAMSGVLKPEVHEKVVGLAQVREVFRSSKTGTIAGCMVLEGLIKRNFPIRVLRDNVVVFEGSLESLRRFKEDVSEVRAGMECGIAVKNYSDVKSGDQIEVYEKVEVRREI